MYFLSRFLFYLTLCKGVLCLSQVSFVSQLSCRFSDPQVIVNNEGKSDAQLVHRQAVLQFGVKGKTPDDPQAITFLVTGSKLELRQYLEGAEAEQIECEIWRFSTEGNLVRWPYKGEQEYSRWYICNLRHSKDLFAVTSFLRQTSDQPPPGKPDHHSWPTIKDGEILMTTVATITKTLSLSVKTGLKSEPKLHCQFAVDHKAPQVTVEWFRYHHGQKITLFSHNTHTGQTQGSGVELSGISNGDASLTVPKTDFSSEGMYFCSVSVNPVFTTMDVRLQIEASPQVFLNVEPTLSLEEDEEMKVICTAQYYYPLEVEVFWYSQELSDQKVGVPLTKVPHSYLHTSHKSSRDNTYTRSAIFFLKASFRDSGRQFTCRVSHRSLGEPMDVSFILTVTGKHLHFWVVFVAVDAFLIVVLYKLMLPLCSRRTRSPRSQPY